MAAPLKVMNTAATAAICIALIMIMSCALSCSGEENVLFKNFPKDQGFEDHEQLQDYEEAETLCHHVRRCQNEMDERKCKVLCIRGAGKQGYKVLRGKCHNEFTPHECCCSFYFLPPPAAME